MILAQILSKVISSRIVGAFLVVGVVGSILPATLLDIDIRKVYLIQCILVMASNYYMYCVISSIMVVLFNEAWKARLVGVYVAWKNLLEFVGVLASAAIYQYNEDLLLPFFMCC